jgi:hypothetical protein
MMAAFTSCWQGGALHSEAVHLSAPKQQSESTSAIRDTMIPQRAQETMLAAVGIICQHGTAAVLCQALACNAVL